MLTVERLMKDQQIIKNNLLKNPLVSVIMPTYCRKEDSLRKSIESVLSQTFTDFEFIIIDDGSRDGTFQILLEYQKKDKRIMIIRHNLNCGLPAIRVNEGLMQARGKYIAYQFDDDEWLPNCLNILVNKIEQQPIECVVYGKCEAIIEEASGINTQMFLGTQVDNSMLKNRNYVANNSVIHHSSILNLTGLYDPHIILRRCCDYDLWIRMSKFVPFIYVDELVSRVNAGKKNSLGVDENLTIIKMSNIRIMLEINRNDMLKAHNIHAYHVDDMGQFTQYFSSQAIDMINRISVIPFRLKANYYLQPAELCIANLSRPVKKTLAVVKRAYSKTVEVLINNFTKRIEGFPYNHYFIAEDELYFIKHQDYDLLIVVGEMGMAFDRYMNNYSTIKIPVMNVLEDFMFQYYEKEKNNWISQSNSNLMQQISTESVNVICDDRNRNQDECKSFKRVLTNIPERYFTLKMKEQPSSKIKIALFVHESLNKELKIIFKALKHLKQIRSLIIHIWGNTTIPFRQLPCVVENREFNKNFENQLEELKTSYYDYYICPLSDESSINNRKSILTFIEGTAMGGVGIFSKAGPFLSIPDELCFKADLTQWSKVLEQTFNLSEKMRYDRYYKAHHFIRKNHLTENQTHRFISYLDVTLLQQKMKSIKIAYFLSNNAMEYQIDTIMLHRQIVNDYGFETIICLPIKPSEYLLKVTEQIDDIVLNQQYESGALNREQSNHLSQWLQSDNIGFVHILGYLPTVGYACHIAKVPHVNSLYDQEKKAIRKENVNQFINYIHTTSNQSGAFWSDIFDIPFCKLLYPIDTSYFDLYKIKGINKEIVHKKRVLLHGPINVDDMKQQLLNLGLEDRIELITNNNDESLIDFRNINILVSNHAEEGISREMLRSMASGVLVIALKSVQINEIIKANYNGLIFEHSTIQAIAEQIKVTLDMEQNNMEEILYNAHCSAIIACKKDFISAELIHLYDEAINVFNDLSER